jgi:hypothetical protein
MQAVDLRRQTSLIGATKPAILAVNKPQYSARKGEGAMTEERIRELTKTMLRKKLYVVLSKGGAAPEKIAEHLPHHLEYMIGLEKQGVLFASGPLAETAATASPSCARRAQRRRARSPRPTRSW